MKFFCDFGRLFFFVVVLVWVVIVFNEQTLRGHCRRINQNFKQDISTIRSLQCANLTVCQLRFVVWKFRPLNQPNKDKIKNRLICSQRPLCRNHSGYHFVLSFYFCWKTVFLVYLGQVKYFTWHVGTQMKALEETYLVIYHIYILRL